MGSSQTHNEGHPLLGQARDAPWRQLLDRPSKLALFQTCRQLRDMVLSSSKRVTVTFHLRSRSTCASVRKQHCPEEQAVKSLRLLLQFPAMGRDLMLNIVAINGVADEMRHGSPSPGAALFTQWLRRLCEQGSMPPSALIQVTHINLQGPMLGNLVPACLTTACPNMRHLTREAPSARGPLPKYPSQPPQPCPQLHSLTLHECLGTQPQLPAATVQQQVNSLPNLQQLVLSQNELYRWQQCLVPGSALRSQLTSLTLTCDPWEEDDDEGLAWAPSLPNCLAGGPAWQHLHQLHMPGHGIDDSDTAQLLQHMPQLTHLHVLWFDLDNSYTDCACSWRQLSVAELSLCELAHLPLAGLTSLQLCEWTCHELLPGSSDRSYPAGAGRAKLVLNSPGLLPAAAANVAGSSVVITYKPADPVTTSGFPLVLGAVREAERQHLPTLLPILQRLQPAAFHISLMRDPTAWLPLLAQLQISTLQLQWDALPADAWPSLMAQLPQVSVLELQVPAEEEEEDDDDAHAIQHAQHAAASAMGVLCCLCIPATRTFTLCVSGTGKTGIGLCNDWQVMLRAGMQAAGHQHVTITER